MERAFYEGLAAERAGGFGGDEDENLEGAEEAGERDLFQLQQQQDREDKNCPAARGTSPSGGSPALRGDPYSPEAVEARIKPPYSVNLKHVPGSGYYSPRADVLPQDAEEAYSRAEQFPIGTWWAKG